MRTPVMIMFVAMMFLYGCLDELVHYPVTPTESKPFFHEGKGRCRISIGYIEHTRLQKDYIRDFTYEDFSEKKEVWYWSFHKELPVVKKDSMLMGQDSTLSLTVTMNPQWSEIRSITLLDGYNKRKDYGIGSYIIEYRATNVEIVSIPIVSGSDTTRRYSASGKHAGKYVKVFSLKEGFEERDGPKYEKTRDIYNIGPPARCTSSYIIVELIKE